MFRRASGLEFRGLDFGSKNCRGSFHGLLCMAYRLYCVGPEVLDSGSCKFC